jgi:predicted transporter
MVHKYTLALFVWITTVSTVKTKIMIKILSVRHARSAKGVTAQNARLVAGVMYVINGVVKVVHQLVIAAAVKKTSVKTANLRTFAASAIIATAKTAR